ncbi:hypothetical protein RHMOL_Rhmol05G0175800 [Rhododendron molle]|uniref:Uncharacterized protein n=1 Tax=Rhododendron molle TaxID=49168 RepID=A0ACC0NR88_RHOML|nr:hypothetical protein RHMOL_Rhmol05G0175800 [Rhododendron molle]
MNGLCEASSWSEWQKGWPLRSGEFAYLCDKCGRRLPDFVGKSLEFARTRRNCKNTPEARQKLIQVRRSRSPTPILDDPWTAQVRRSPSPAAVLLPKPSAVLPSSSSSHDFPNLRRDDPKLYGYVGFGQTLVSYEFLLVIEVKFSFFNLRKSWIVLSLLRVLLTQPWGSVQAAMGHPEPFDLRYVVVGNEDCGEKNYRGSLLPALAEAGFLIGLERNRSIVLFQDSELFTIT